MNASYTLTEKDFKIFAEARDQFYLLESKPSMMAAYIRMIIEKYSRQDESGKRVIPPENEIPKPSQFFRFLKKEKETDLSHELSARSAGTSFDLAHAEKLYHLDYGAIGPGFCYLTDSTLMDWDLVSEFHRNKNIGRPTLTVYIDLFSRLRFVFLSLLKESFDSYRYALHFAVSDKSDYTVLYIR